jgi:electron transport complex protein RnfG
MPEWIKFPLVLAVVGLISAASLAGLYKVTLPRKEAMRFKQTENALYAVFPGAKKFDSVENAAPDLPVYYIAKDESGKTIGYAVEGEGQGYGGLISLMAGVDTSLKITGIKIYSQKETPGLGDKIVEVLSKKTWKTVLTGTTPDERRLKPYFQIQFENKNAPFKLKKDGGDIEAITGATISSQGVVNAVNAAVLKLQNTLAVKRP